MLASRGAHVVVADLNLEGAEELVDQIRSEFGLRRALAVETDVTSEDAVAALIHRTVLEYGDGEAPPGAPAVDLWAAVRESLGTQLG